LLRALPDSCTINARCAHRGLPPEFDDLLVLIIDTELAGRA